MSDHFQLELTLMEYSKNRPKATHPLKIMDLTFRDGQQSIFATKGRTEDMVPVAKMMDEVGFWAIETWGGATFGSMIAYLNEDPWERIKTLKPYFKKTPVSMLLNGQGLIAHGNHADDLVKVFIEKSAENGIDIFRTYDALNDFRNMETAFAEIKRCEKHFQACICYSMTEYRLGGEIYNIEYYVNKAKELSQTGVDSICIKDVAGMMAPYDAFNIITNIKKEVSIPVVLHTHFTSGMGSMTQLKAIEAGVDIIDTCMAPYSFRNSLPAVEPLVMGLLGTNRDTGFDIEKLAEINEVFEKDILPKYKHLLNDNKVSIIDNNVPVYQAPTGLLSNIESQLKDMGEQDKLSEVLEILPKIRKDFGQIPLVTPTSRLISTQAVNNVIFDKVCNSYSIITAQVQDLCYGLYGKTPTPIDLKLIKKALKNYSKGKEPITSCPREVLEPELEAAKKGVSHIAKNIEDEIIYALFPVTGVKFLKRKYGIEEPPADMLPRTIEECLKEEKLIAKIRAGKVNGLKEPDTFAPPKTEFLRKFKVFIEDEYFVIEMDEEGRAPVVTYASGPIQE